MRPLQIGRRICCSRSLQILILFGGIFYFFINFYHPKITNSKVHYSIKESKDLIHSQMEQYGSVDLKRSRIIQDETKTENNNGVLPDPLCKIPLLEPFDESVHHLLRNYQNLNCGRKSKPYISYVKNDQIMLNISILAKSSRQYQIYTINCELAFIQRISDLEEKLSDVINITIHLTKKAYDSDQVLADLKSDFYFLKCKAWLDGKTKGNKYTLYQEWKAHISKTPNGDSKRKNDKSGALDLDVVFIGFDSTSRMNFLRKMPKSYKYMMNKLGTVVLEGYNIVGDATTGALIPLFTGQFQRELPNVNKDWWLFGQYVDKAYPLLWKMYQTYGYKTLYAEDSPRLSAWNLQLKGFEEQPTDHYMRHYWKQVTQSIPSYNPIHRPMYCNGPVPTHRTLMDYTAEFQTVFQNDRKFAFTFATELTHGNINRLGQVDDDLYDYLKSSHEKGLLDNTLLIVFGDHGARYTKIRQTMQGKLEERLPFFSITLPKWFRSKHPSMWENLMRNSKILSTPFDIHATLLSVLNPSLKSKHGLNLLGEIPWSRTCEDASIDSHWCTCMSWESVPIDDEKMLFAAEKLVEMINNKIKIGQDKCAKLELDAVKHAEFRIPNQNLLKFFKTQGGEQIDPGFDPKANVNVHDLTVEYEVTIETVPGGGLYEGSVRVKLGNFTVDEEMSRINAYGDQPHCIMDMHPHIRKFCYCKDLISNNFK